MVGASRIICSFVCWLLGWSRASWASARASPASFAHLFVGSWAHPHHLLICLLALGLEHLQVTDQHSFTALCLSSTLQHLQATDVQSFMALAGHHPHHLLICMLALGLEHLQVTSSVCWENRQVTDPHSMGLCLGNHQHHLIMGWNSDLQNCTGLCLGITSFAHVFVGHHLRISLLALGLEHLQVTDLQSFMGLCRGIPCIICSFVC